MDILKANAKDSEDSVGATCSDSRSFACYVRAFFSETNTLLER